MTLEEKKKVLKKTIEEDSSYSEDTKKTLYELIEKNTIDFTSVDISQKDGELNVKFQMKKEDDSIGSQLDTLMDRMSELRKNDELLKGLVKIGISFKKAYKLDVDDNNFISGLLGVIIMLEKEKLITIK